jgi:predicted O-methyltransferase YrrM
MLLLKALKYLVRNPRHVVLYVAGRPSRLVAAAAGRPESEFAGYRAELDAATDFVAALDELSRRHTGDPFRLEGDHYFLYALARAVKPRVLLETGVFDGTFSACFLKGLAQNARRDCVDGRLVSIDLPAYTPIEASTSRYPKRTHLPAGCEPGWIIPDDLRSRWTLHAGDARELLPRVADAAGPVDLFFHDSLHTYDHMMFEFETMWPRLAEGACLLTHDVHWNLSFRDFARRYGQEDNAAHGFGLLRKRPPRS